MARGATRAQGGCTAWSIRSNGSRLIRMAVGVARVNAIAHVPVQGINDEVLSHSERPSLPVRHAGSRPFLP